MFEDQCINDVQFRMIIYLVFGLNFIPLGIFIFLSRGTGWGVRKKTWLCVDLLHIFLCFVVAVTVFMNHGLPMSIAICLYNICVWTVVSCLLLTFLNLPLNLQPANFIVVFCCLVPLLGTSTNITFTYGTAMRIQYLVNLASTLAVVTWACAIIAWVWAEVIVLMLLKSHQPKGLNYARRRGPRVMALLMVAMVVVSQFVFNDVCSLTGSEMVFSVIFDIIIWGFYFRGVQRKKQLVQPSLKTSGEGNNLHCNIPSLQNNWKSAISVSEESKDEFLIDDEGNILPVQSGLHRPSKSYIPFVFVHHTNGTLVIKTGNQHIKKTKKRRPKKLILATGSHAIVRMVGQEDLRVALVASTFGNAHGHAALGRGGEVLFAGELEVDANGHLLRWNNKSGTYRVPQKMIRQVRQKKSKNRKQKTENKHKTQNTKHKTQHNASTKNNDKR